MTRAYRVREGFGITVDGVSYIGGQVVLLTREQAQYHAPYIDPVMEWPEVNELPAEIWLRDYGQDVVYSYFFEQRALEIVSLTGSNPTTVTTRTPHFLTGTVNIVLRVLSATLAYSPQLVATVTGANTFTVPGSFVLPPDPEFAEIGVPADLTGATFSGGVYDYQREQVNLIVYGTAATVAGSNRLSIISAIESEAGKFSVGDVVTVGETLTNVRVLAKTATIKLANGSFEALYWVGGNAVTTGNSNQITGQRTNVLTAMGGPFAGKSFAIDVNAAFGRLTLRLESSQLADLPNGVYPVQVIRTQGPSDVVVLKGRLERSL